MRFVFTLLFVCSFIHLSFSQIQGDGGTLPSILYSINSIESQVIFQQPDIKKLRAEDAIQDKSGNKAWRFGVMNETNLTTANSGSWSDLSNGGRLWQLEIKCLNAQTVNLILSNTSIPSGNSLYISNLNKDFVLGKFTNEHLYQSSLGTELVPGDIARIEYYVAPENLHNIGKIEVSGVSYGYRSLNEFDLFAKSFGQAQACHKNINCPEAAAFQNQKRSVVFIVSSGVDLCTGTLINNTNYDGKPYILTANHCYGGGNLPNWVFRFNYESADCSNPPTSPTFQSISGSQLLARRQMSDFLLVEIVGGLENGTIPSSFNAYFSGWDRSGYNLENAVSIHHPRGDIKKISFEDDVSLPAQSVIGGITSDVDGVWKVKWNRSTATEGGSSGSPLFDQNKRVVGQLWGGQSSCSNLNGNDFYGRIATSWNPSGSNSTNQLEFWLDPANSGTLVLDGFDFGNRLTLDAALVHPKDASGTLCNSSIQPKITLVNMGQSTIDSVRLSYGVDATQIGEFTWNGSLPSLGSVEIVLPLTPVSQGAHQFFTTIVTVNGVSDELAENNEQKSDFYRMNQPQEVTLALNTDDYGSETSWMISDDTSGVVYFSSMTYQDITGGQLYNDTFCLEDGCYKFTVLDAYQDGMTYGTPGHFVIRDNQNNLLAQMTQSQAAFTDKFEVRFCIGELSIQQLENQFLFYPNPSKGIINWTSNEVVRIEVFDVNGKQLLNQDINGEQSISLKTLNSGIYLVNFSLKNGQVLPKKVVLLD